MSEEPSVRRFREMLHVWAKGYADSRGLSDPAIDSFDDLHPDEARGFMKAVDEGIVRVDAVGGCTLPGLDRLHGQPTEPSTLFWRKKLPISIAWREYVMQVGVVAHLIVDQGWPEHQVALDPEADSTFDVATYLKGAEGERPFVAAEVKTLCSQPSLERMLADVRSACEARLPEDALDLQRNDGHKKYRGLLRHRPAYLLLVKPGVWLAHKVDWEAGWPTLRPVPSVPRFESLPRLDRA